MIQRPKRGETEEELLRMQEEYLLQKSKDPNTRPAAQVTSLQRPVSTTKRAQTTTPGTRKPSKFAQAKGLLNHPDKRPRIEASSSSVIGDILEKNVEEPPKNKQASIEDDKVYFPTVIPSVLGNIVEKNLDVHISFESQPMPSQGFPEVTKRDPSLKPLQNTVHNQNLELNQEQCTKMEVDDQISNKEKSNIPVNVPDKSYMVSSKEATDIHNENIKLLGSMSQKDILEEQQKLLTSLDPRLIEFIKAKRQGQPNNKLQENTQNISVQMDTSSVTEAFQKPSEVNIVQPTLDDVIPKTSDYDDLWDNDVLTHPQVNKWLHFDSLEKDKLEWMKSIEKSKEVKPDEPYEARFDFTGYLLPYTIEYTEQTKTLFHHGEEPHRPGYSLNELIELSRSAVTQQRVMALNTLAGIIEYYNAGTYKDFLELPLSKIFFIVRIAMDENKVIILEPALKAMRNLLYSRIDEASLDALIGFEEGNRQPWLENDKSEIEELDSKESDLKDFHLAEIDLIAAILRTDILQRLFYILDTVRPNFNCVQYALQILTRLARDSLDTAMKIIQADHLMKAVIKNFLPTTSINFAFDPQLVYKGKPVLSAVRFLRVLCVRSGETGKIILEKYDILKPISEYISSGVDGTYGLRIQIESYCLLSNLLSCDPSTVNSLLPLIITTLYKHVEGTDIFVTSSVLSATHAAVVLQLINTFLCYHTNDIESYKTQIYPLLIKGTEKWIKQISQADGYTCAHLRLLSAAIDCIITALIIENVPVKFFNDSLKGLISSQGFKEMIKNLELSSNLLSGLESKDLYLTKNLMSLSSSVIDSAQKVLPILNATSPLPFLASLFKLLTQINEKQITEGFLEHITPYLKKFAKKAPALADNWFTRIEIDFMFNVLKVATKNCVSESDKDLVYAVANKLCYVLRVDKRNEICFLFKEIVFNKDWFSVERILHLLNLSDVNAPGRDVLEDNAHASLDEISRCYDRVINASCVPPDCNLYLLKWREPILPRDWIYMPILALYGRRLDTAPKAIGDLAKRHAAKAMEDKKFIVSCSLEWIIFNEICFPDLLNDIDVTDRFCRVMCVFLCDDSLFLDPKISKLLQKCTWILFKKKAGFNFDKEFVGLHNFEDFYTEVLQQFQSVSYGDPTFAACVLVPMAQKHNVKWRQLIWYEYVGCLRYLDCPQEILCYPLEDYLQPEETDKRLLESYHRALSCNYVRPDTVACKIAKHHMLHHKTKMSLTGAATAAV